MTANKLIIIGVVLVFLAYHLFKNSPPVLAPDNLPLTGDSMNIDALANDSDPDNDNLKIVGVSEPAYGEVSIVSGGTKIQYKADKNYFGKVSFTYQVSDGSEDVVSSEIIINIPFEAPKFQLRSDAATLAEMLQEPPSTVYGSSIDVFYYQDGDSKPKEISIAGHADSLTCAETSSVFAGTLMVAGSRKDDFLLAGAGQMKIPKTTEQEEERFKKSEEVGRYKSLLDELSIAKWEKTISELFDTENNSISRIETLESRLAKLEEHRDVVDFKNLKRPAILAESFIREAEKIEQKSGLLRIHRLPYSIVEDATRRVLDAVSLNKASVLKFNDLLPDAESEAVFFTPMLDVKTGKRVEVTIPLGEFSPKGFRKAAIKHRSAMEHAVKGNAQKRFDHASRLLGEAEEQKEHCLTLSEYQSSELVSTITCSKDDCPEDLFGNNKMTWKKYCDEQIPINLEVANSWKKEAEDILKNLEEARQRGSQSVLDKLTHAALIDSMLRNWALPVPDAQAAFDHWREDGRSKAWKAISTELMNKGFSRSTFAGESIVFDIEMSDSDLIVKPNMLIDVKRSIVLVDPKVGVTTASMPWEFRQAKSTNNSINGKALKTLLGNPEEFVDSLRMSPEQLMGQLQSDLRAELKADGKFWQTRKEVATLYEIIEEESRLSLLLEKMDESNVLLFEGGNDHLLSLLEVVFAAQTNAPFTTEFRLAVALRLTKELMGDLSLTNDDYWKKLADVNAGKSANPFKTTELNAFALFGKSGKYLVKNILKKAELSDPDFVGIAIKKKRLPNRPSEVMQQHIVQKNKPVETLVSVVTTVEQLRSTIRLREDIVSALGLFDEQGSVIVKDLKSVLNSNVKDLQYFAQRIVNELQTRINFTVLSSGNRIKLKPVDGLEIQATLIRKHQSLEQAISFFSTEIEHVRFGRSQEMLKARVLYEKGEYLDALQSLMPERIPLSLVKTKEDWQLLTEKKALPYQASLRVDKSGLDAVIDDGAEMIPVLRLEGVNEDYLRKLESQPFLFSIQDWNEGEALWQQVLLNQVISPSSIFEARESINKNETLHLALLKAMVYSCSMPAQDIVDPSGRCKNASGSTQLHDRVIDSKSIVFETPSEKQTIELTKQRHKL